MNSHLPYDRTDRNSILRYARTLHKKCLRDLYGDEIPSSDYSSSGKGNLGRLIEKYFFKYQPNSMSLPDFPEAGLELKTSPLKNRGGDLVSKERMVLNMISFDKREAEKGFFQSGFWKKNKRLLLMFYLYEPDKRIVEYLFEIVRIWRFPKNDLKIIIDDWLKIREKIRSGNAEHLSEGDTFYLGACTKGARGTDRVAQGFSEIKAKPRAYALKSRYVDHIIQDSRRDHYLSFAQDSAPVVSDISIYKKHETFEELIINRFSPYYGESDHHLFHVFGLEADTSKQKYFDLTRAILGVKKKKVEEFEKAGVEMKTIRLKNNGIPTESMSFSQIDYREIINETWESSYWHNTLTKRFFFIVFKYDGSNILRLFKVMFWTMPAIDLEKAERFWRDTRSKVQSGKYDDFIKISSPQHICHVRPKARNSRDFRETPQGTKAKKYAYWLNASYIAAVVSADSNS